MPTFSIQDITIQGISCCVPKNKELNRDITFIDAAEIEKFISVTGVEERRIVQKNVCTSDLCFEAAEKLIQQLNWDKKDIEILIFVSQSSDYIVPNTAPILQDRLGLSTNCIAFDVPLGCSGYVYGLSIIASMMKSCGLKKGLLLAGDTCSKLISSIDKSTMPLFGDAGSATALEFVENQTTLLFDLGTDGSGFKTIIIEDGGSRNQTTNASLEYQNIAQDIDRNACQLILDGMDVFSFGISQAPNTVNNLLEKFSIDKEKIDYFVFHQANMMMNKMIAKKLKLRSEKVPTSLRNYGNTSSATIPLTIVTELKEAVQNKPMDILMCGFGVGLSWGTVVVQNNTIKELIYIEI